jgi:hypothetical protein
MKYWNYTTASRMAVTTTSHYRNYNGITLKREKNFSPSRENDAEAAAKAADVGESR